MAANRVIDDEAAHEIAAVFFEDLVAPDYTQEAVEVLRRKADLRVFVTHADQGTRGPNGSSPMPFANFWKLGKRSLVKSTDLTESSAKR